MLRKHQSIGELIEQMGGKLGSEENQLYVEGVERYLSRDEFCKLLEPILEEHH